MPSRRLFTFNGKNNGLIIVYGKYGSGKTTLFQKWTEQHGIPYLNINSLISEQTIGSPSGDRPEAVQREFRDTIDGAEGDVALCDNLELLFAADLSLDPLRLLKQAARTKTVVAAWDGSWDGSNLSYAVPGHDEYRVYSPADLRGVTIYSVNEASAL
ncbi:hypothetical protein J2129_000863 [Methanofollis sp. W23]|nr:hypothetical protein [Methanofollis sp. W23]